MTAVVSVRGVVQLSGTLTALAGSQVRGVQGSTYTPPFGPYVGVGLFQITVYANSVGEEISFVFLSAGGEAVPLAETVVFLVGRSEGSEFSPLVLTGPALPPSPSLPLPLQPPSPLPPLPPSPPPRSPLDCTLMPVSCLQCGVGAGAAAGGCGLCAAFAHLCCFSFFL